MLPIPRSPFGMSFSSMKRAPYVCCIVLCVLWFCTICKHNMCLFCSIIVWFIQKSVWNGQKMQKMAMDTKHQPICTIISLLSLRYLFVRSMVFRFMFFIPYLVCRSHIYKICKFRFNCAGEANALTLKQ